MGTGCYSASEIPNIYVTAGKDPCGKTLTALTCYTDNPDAVPKSFTAELLGIGEVCAVCLLDEEHNFDKIAEYYPDKEQIHITIKPNTVIVIA